MICLSQLVRGEPNPQFDEMFQLPIESLDKKVELVAVERNIELHQAGAETYLGKTQISVNSLECNW